MSTTTVMGSNQETLTLNHLKNVGSISGIEAEALYKIRHLPKRISNLKEQGWKITSSRMKDATGQRYVRYHLDAKQRKAVTA